MRGTARAALLAAAIATATVSDTAHNAHSTGPADPDHTAIVVFTGALNRITEGTKLYAKGKGSILFITGIDMNTAPYQKLADMGEFSQFSVDNKAINTYENGVATRDWLKGRDIKRIILVTSDFHMERSLAVLKRELHGSKIHIDTHAVESNIPHTAKRWERLKTMATVYLGISRIPGTQLSI